MEYIVPEASPYSPLAKYGICSAVSIKSYSLAKSDKPLRINWDILIIKAFSSSRGISQSMPRLHLVVEIAFYLRSSLNVKP